MIKYAEFCAGIGGFSLALNELGWDCVYGNEIDEKCENTYKCNFDRTFDSKDIFSINSQLLPDFDVLCAGFPCQPFSIAGKQNGFMDTRGNIYFKILDIIENKKPKVVFLENVKNLLSHDEKRTSNFIFKSLKDLGYNVFYKVLDSKEFGVPQSRPRIYIVAFNNDIDSTSFEFKNLNPSKVTIREIINSGDFSIPITRKWDEYIDLYTNKKTEEDISFEVPKTRKKLEKIGKNVDLNDCIFQIRSSGIRAISLDEQHPTFAVSNSGGGAMIPVYSKERRHLNLIEIKRIMGFPETFIFPVSRTDAIKQLANSVCPPVIKSIGISIEEILG